MLDCCFHALGELPVAATGGDPIAAAIAHGADDSVNGRHWPCQPR